MLKQPSPPEAARLDKARDAVQERLSTIHWQVSSEEVGTVVRAGDGIAYLRGLPSVRYGELLEGKDGLTGLAFDLWPQEVGVLFLDPADQLSAGDTLRATGRVASVAVGEELLGRVVDALGRPLDGAGPMRAKAIWPVEYEAPGVVDRMPVHEPLLTGTKMIDALFPLGACLEKG